MPLYEFVCIDCQTEQELLVRGDESPACENCGSGALSKLLSAPSAHGTTTGDPQLPPGSCGSGCGCFPQ